MLKELIIDNLVLVERTTVQFAEGFTVITGETGAGKSALIAAIDLILGERADSSKLRKGCDKGFVQAVFSPLADARVLEEAGIDYDGTEELIISRHVSSAGKSRAFIAGQAVPLSLLQSLRTYLIDPVDQHAAIALKNPKNQLQWLDLFAGCNHLPFQENFQREKALARQLEQLKLKEEKGKEREQSLLQQIEELSAAKIEENEDKRLFEEYSLASNAQELLIECFHATQTTEQLLAHLIPLTASLEKSAQKAEILSDAASLSKDASMSLTEICAVLQKLQGQLEIHPQRLQFLEERLALIDRLQRKYGANLSQAEVDLKQELDALGQLQEQIHDMTNQLQMTQSVTEIQAEKLSERRKKGANELALALTQQLQELNIPHARVIFALSKASRSAIGDDQLEILLQANKGENPTPLHEGTSGGELARIYFCLKLLLAHKQTSQTLIFDEVDANVGGETATVIGEALKKLGKNRQVLCITHFPQVAKQADHHLQVSKQEKGDRTISKIDLLNANQRHLELLRMIGGREASTI